MQPYIKTKRKIPKHLIKERCKSKYGSIFHTIKRKLNNISLNRQKHNIGGFFKHLPSIKG